MQKINREPDYNNINTMMKLLYGNAASLPKTLGGGQHVHIGIIMTPQLYTTLVNTPYDSPPDPSIIPTHAIGTSAEIHQTNFLFHKEEGIIFDNHQTMEDALKSVTIDAVDKLYIGKLCNKYSGYLGITARNLLDHLLDCYEKKNPNGRRGMKKHMNEPIDSTQPIDIYFKRIDATV